VVVFPRLTEELAKQKFEEPSKFNSRDGYELVMNSALLADSQGRRVSIYGFLGGPRFWTQPWYKHFPRESQTILIF
jgi:hypothetical protein